MKVPTQSGEKAAFFEALFEDASSYASDLFTRMDEARRQYKGDPVIDGFAERASVVRNITYELIESQVSVDLPSPAVTPRVADAVHEQNARSVETLLKNKRNELPFERWNDLDERFSPIYGGSVWLVEWDEGIRTPTTIGDARVTCLSPRRFLGQPHIAEVSDMDYCFITFETSHDDLIRRYGVAPSLAESAAERTPDGADTVSFTVCYYKDEDGHVGEFIWSGDTVLLDLPSVFTRKHKKCSVCGEVPGACHCEKPDFVRESEESEVLLSDLVMKDGTVLPAGTVLPYYEPKLFPVVIRRNTSEEGSLLGQSDCEFVRSLQQAINRIESRICEKVCGGGIYPLVPDDFEGELDNSIFRKVFRCNEHNRSLFGSVDLEADIARDMEEADRLYEHAKRILGISDTYLGLADSTAQSGKAKQIQIDQAKGRLASKKQMKNAAYADIDRILFGYYLAFADEPRVAVCTGAGGKRENVSFCRYDFLTRDESGRFYYDDSYLFSCNSDDSESGEALWESIGDCYKMGAFGDPDSQRARLLYWQNMERARYPLAHENVEKMREEQGGGDDMEGKKNSMATNAGGILKSKNIQANDSPKATVISTGKDLRDGVKK